MSAQESRPLSGSHAHQISNPKPRRRRSTAVSVALPSFFGALGFGFFVQCGPSQGRLGTSTEIYGAADIDQDKAASSLGGVVEIFDGDPTEPKFAGRSQLQAGLHRASSKLSDLDPNFCHGLAYGQCLTLILQIPAAELQQSLGLSVLNLVHSSPKWRSYFERSCNEGLFVGIPNAARSGPGRSRVLGGVARSRCLLQTLSDESTPLPKLANNEMGFKVRLVDFNLVSKATSTSPAVGRVAFENVRVEFKFHDAHVFGQGRWQPLRGAVNLWNLFNHSGVFGTAHAGINFNERLTFQFDGPGTLDYLNSRLDPVFEAARSGEGLGELGAEILVVKQSVAALAAGSNPVVPTIILVGVAVDAVHDLCSHRASDCQIRRSESDVLGPLGGSSEAAEVLPSTTRAQLMDGLKHLPFAVVQGIFRHAHLAEMEKALQLPTKPFWVSM